MLSGGECLDIWRRVFEHMEKSVWTYGEECLDIWRRVFEQIRAFGYRGKQTSFWRYVPESDSPDNGAGHIRREF
jgi:hypothetical protein